MATKKSTKESSTKEPLRSADEQSLPDVEKGRADLDERTALIHKGLADGSVKVAIVAHLEADGSVGQFVTDGTASRIELIGLAANLLNNLQEQDL